MTGQCEITGCQKPAKYALYKTYSNGKKLWLHVCRGGEEKIGSENLRHVGIHPRRVFLGGEHEGK